MADNYRVNDVNDPWNQYRNIIGFPSRKRIICGIICVFFILTLVVISFTFMSKMCCSKDSKLETYAAFHNNLNFSVDPCVDFYRFSCDMWEANNPLPSYDGQITNFNILQDVINKEKRRIFAKSKQSNDLPRTVNYAIEFYSNCVEQNSTLDDSEVLQNFFNKIGGWPILNTNNWNEDSFDWFQASAFLIENLDLPTIIDVNSIDNNKSGDRNVIYLKPPSVLHDDKTLNDMITKQMLYSILVSLNSSNLHSDVMNGIEDLSITETKWKNQLNYSKDMEPLHITVGELEQRIPTFGWLKYLQLIMNNTLWEINETITLDDIVVIESFNYLEKVVVVLNSGIFSKQQLANLFGWFVVKDIWILIPAVLRNYVDQSGYNSDDEKNAANIQCYDIVQEIFSCSLDYLYVKNSSHLGIEESRNLTTYLNSAFKDIIEESSWVNETVRKNLLTKLNSMQQIIGYLSYLNNKTEFDKMYADFPYLSPNILKSYLEVQKYYVKMRILHLKLPVRPQDWILPRSISDASAYYIIHRNSLVYPLSLHNSPFYYLYGPFSLNFGAMGFVIAHEIMHAFDNFTELKIESDIYRNHSQCFKDQYDIYDNNRRLINNGSLTLRENIADNEGLHIAFRAYKKHEKEVGYKQKFVSFKNFTSDQMFFISYGTMLCSYVRSEKHKIPPKNTHSLPEFRVNKAVSNSKFFALAFKCPDNSPMNPVKKCSLW